MALCPFQASQVLIEHCRAMVGAIADHKSKRERLQKQRIEGPLLWITKGCRLKKEMLLKAWRGLYGRLEAA